MSGEQLYPIFHGRVKGGLVLRVVGGVVTIVEVTGGTVEIVSG